jgi:hypothetical protein
LPSRQLEEFKHNLNLRRLWLRRGVNVQDIVLSRYGGSDESGQKFKYCRAVVQLYLWWSDRNYKIKIISLPFLYFVVTSHVSICAIVGLYKVTRNRWKSPSLTAKHSHGIRAIFFLKHIYVSSSFLRHHYDQPLSRR